MRLSLGRSRWSWLRATTCVLALLFFGQASEMHGASRLGGAARASEISALDSAHARLSALMDAELERSVAAALTQLDDGGAALVADRSEFVLSALVPIASALDETRTKLDEGAQ
jgi:hypothetical protein